MNTDDPKMTAFALGELDETERREIEALLQDDPAAAAEVAQLRDFSTMVRTVLAAETAPSLGPVQRAELLATARGESAKETIPENEKPAPSMRRRPLWIPSAIAATVMIAGWYAFLHQPLDRFSQMSTPDFEASGGSGMIAEEVSRPQGPAPLPTGTLAPSAPEPKLDSITTATPSDAAVKSLTQAKDESSVAFKLQPTPQAPAAPASAGGLQLDPNGRMAANEGSVVAVGRAGLRAKDGANAYAGSTTGSDDARLQLEKSEAAAPLPSPAREGKKAFPGYSSTDEMRFKSAETAEKPAMKTAAKVSATPAAAGLTDNDRMRALRDSRRDQSVRPIASVAPAAAPAQPPLSKITPMEESQAATATKAIEGDSFDKTLPDVRRFADAPNTESYDSVTDNPFLTAKENPLSTFSIDVDTASYANVRRFLTSGQLPPKGAVRIEELVNYFHYDYPQPKAGEPFSVNMEVAGCPWTPEHRLLRIGLKGREIPREQRPPANLVFLVDVSGSMSPENKLPLVKESLRLLVDQLSEKDTVSIAVYAGASGTVLEPTHDKAAIREALGRLGAGGSTNGGAGLRLAYQLARRSFDQGKTNRVILATDGDFNVGTTSQSELVDLITSEAKSGVFLTVLGFGYGNLKDSTMEKLADKGNGNYAYIDTLAEGKKVLVEQMAGTLITIAKDVKIQVEFNPRQVSGYRLIGYENRILAKEDFNNDKKDAGEIGAGHTVTALYELVPVNMKTPALTTVDPLKYQPKAGAKAASPLETTSERTLTGANTFTGDNRITNDREAIAATKEAAVAAELLTLKLRWKAPDADTSTLREVPLTDDGLTYEKSSKDFRWAASVAGFGMMLRDSQYKGAASWGTIKELAEEGRGEDAAGYRAEFIQLLEKAVALKR